jgi:oxalate decarboxylase
MDPMTRRMMLATGGVLTAGAAMAQGSGQAAEPEAIRGSRGATVLGPRNVPVDLENPDVLASPATDSGSIPNLKWPFAMSHNRLTEAGFARETTIRELPVSKAMAGVDMRLKPGGVRELHWHKADEWALMLAGKARVTCVDPQGRNFVDDVQQGDLWYFPSGYPHSIQALQEGCEFLLVFDDGAFSEDNTFLISQWLAHVPKEVLARNFGEPASAFADIPKDQLYIFNAPIPPELKADRVSDPEGTAPNPFTFHMMQMQPVACPGGTVRIIDSSVFKASTNIAAAYVEIAPGGMRELHWHPLSDEWQYYIAGQARMTVFGSGTNSRTFDYQAGDVGYVPRTMGHYIENTGNEPVRYLEMFVGPRYNDVSLEQWLAVIPPELVKAHLNLSDAVIGRLDKKKQLVVKGGPAAQQG